MKIDYTRKALDDIERLPALVRKAFFKQIGFLAVDPRHPSLRTKKFQGLENVWQCRVNDDWRFYFQIAGDVYTVFKVIPHPK